MSRAVLDVRPVFYVIGYMLIIVAAAMLGPMVVDLSVGSPDWVVFGTSAALTLFFGVLFLLTNWTPTTSLNLRQMFLMTSLAWVLVCCFCSLPYMFGETRLNFADAYFEAMSGLTTTGSTVITGLDALPPGMLLWRSITQWLGGIGIVGLGIAILPFLRVGGMQLFRSESSDRSDKVMPRAGDLAVALGWIYLSLTVACAVLLIIAGMSAFDAINHAMTTLATGGFSTSDASIANWRNPSVEWVLILFMLLGGMPFVRFISFSRGEFDSLWHDTQIRWYVGFLVAVSLVMGTWLAESADLPWLEGLRLAAFNIVSIVTTTGYTSADYSLWGPLAVSAFLLLTVIGGCTGSTAGGIKFFRFEILFMVLRVQLVRLFSPNRVMPLAYNGKPVDSDIMVSVMAFGFVFVAATLLGAVALSMLGLDLVTALSGSATAFANVGPGLGPIIGPVGNFAPIPDAGKWLLSLFMLLGRLEFFTVLVLMNPRFWSR